MISLSVRWGYYGITWTGPRTSEREKTWCLCPSGTVFKRTLSPLLFLPGLNRQYCYQLSDQAAQDLHQVREHDVRAFAASQAFQGGVSLEQILSACHWKAHNTLTQFYLKDLAWADSELYHLGPVVAAQQVQEGGQVIHSSSSLLYILYILKKWSQVGPGVS